MNNPFSVALVVALLAAPVSASAQEAGAERGSGPQSTLRYNLAIDLTITLSATAVWASLELLAPTLATSCRWCDRNSDGTDSLNGFDAGLRRALRWHDTKTANTLSTVFSFGLAPLAGIGVGAIITAHDHRLHELPADMLVVAESAMLALDLNQITKFVVSRERPNVHARTAAERAARRSSADNLSFFSGHTTLAFALAVSAGTIGSMRHYKLAPLMWVSGLALAATSGYLRIAADRHYATDVLAGVIVGSAVGFSVPYFAHRPRGESMRLGMLPVQGGTGLALSGVW